MRFFNHLFLLATLLAILVGGCADGPQASLQQAPLAAASQQQNNEQTSQDPLAQATQGYAKAAARKKEKISKGVFATAKLAELPLAESRAAKKLRSQIDKILSNKYFSKSQLGVYIISPETGQTLYEHNAHTPLVPASNIKLFATAAVLEALGPDYRFETKLLTNGTITPNGLDGDLIVQGSGDPSFSRRFLHHDPKLVFREWADGLKKKGIKIIYGDLVGDASLLSEHGQYPGWLESDASLWYAAKTSTLVFNDNCVNITISRVKGNKLRTFLEPDTGLITVNNAASISKRRRPRVPLSIARVPGGNSIRVSGRMPRNAKHRTRTLTVNDPDSFFMSALSKTFLEDGVAVEGQVQVEHDPNYLEQQPHLEELHVHRSLPLADLVEYTNKKSLNLYAEQFLKTVGARFHVVGSRETGVMSVNSWLNSMGVPADEHDIQDGSGLSIYNKVSPFAFGMLLRHISQQEYFKDLYDSLPVAGKDGTLRHRMRDTPAYNNVHAKTGYMKRVCALSGYVTDADKNTLIFSIIGNTHRNMPGLVKKAQNKICALLAAYSDKRASGKAAKHHAPTPINGKRKTTK